jgi:hypothetical protein
MFVLLITLRFLGIKTYEPAEGLGGWLYSYFSQVCYRRSAASCQYLSFSAFTFTLNTPADSSLHQKPDATEHAAAFITVSSPPLRPFTRTRFTEFRHNEKLISQQKSQDKKKVITFGEESRSWMAEALTIKEA